jgi:hypothetical protein
VAVLGLALVAAVLIAVGSIWLAHRTLPHPVREGHNGALSPFLTCVGLVYGALLGFTIVVAWEQFSSAESNVSNEASTLITMYRQTVGMPVPEQTQMRQLVRNYTNAVAGPEWEDAVQVGTGTESARDALNEMYRVLGSDQSSVKSSPISQRFLDQLTTLASERNQRILDAKPRIPGLLWAGLFFGGVVLLVLGGFMRLGNARAHVPAECGRPPAGLTAVRRLLAGPSLRQPVGCHVSAVRAIADRVRLDRPGDMITPAT